MKTVVYRSYRTHDVPAWVNRCLQSVEQWTRAQQFDYRFIDDRLFDRVPQWHRRGAGSNVQVITNLARLVVAREYAALHARSIHAINLCGSWCGKPFQGRALDDRDHLAIVDAIAGTRGAMFASAPAEQARRRRRDEIVAA